MDVERVLAFRLARSGLAERSAGTLAQAAACPASDFARDAALLALAARAADVTREGYDAAVDAGELVVAHALRCAIHALAPGDHALFGRALVGRDDRELVAQGVPSAQALDEVAEATEEALRAGPLDKTALHAQLRMRVRAELLPWCKGCGSHHVAPRLWRCATVRAGARLDSERRYTLGAPGPPPPRVRSCAAFCTSTAPRRLPPSGTGPA